MVKTIEKNVFRDATGQKLSEHSEKGSNRIHFPFIHFRPFDWFKNLQSHLIT